MYAIYEVSLLRYDKTKVKVTLNISAVPEMMAAGITKQMKGPFIFLDLNII